MQRGRKDWLTCSAKNAPNDESFSRIQMMSNDFAPLRDYIPFLLFIFQVIGTWKSIRWPWKTTGLFSAKSRHFDPGLPMSPYKSLPEILTLKMGLWLKSRRTSKSNWSAWQREASRPLRWEHDECRRKIISLMSFANIKDQGVHFCMKVYGLWRGHNEQLGHVRVCFF